MCLTYRFSFNSNFLALRDVICQERKPKLRQKYPAEMIQTFLETATFVLRYQNFWKKNMHYTVLLFRNSAL
jgi:hypothetical protein